MTSDRPTDAVDAILAQWARERPDLDCSPMGPLGRLGRCAVLVRERLDAVFAAYDLQRGEFDVLATLRRAGPPHCLAPTTLFSSLMVTSGTMTHRLKRLETRGLVERTPDPADARSLLVRLTPAGLTLIDAAVTDHVANEHRILGGLDADQRAILDGALAALLRTLGQPAD